MDKYLYEILAHVRAIQYGMLARKKKNLNQRRHLIIFFYIWSLNCVCTHC